MGRRAGSVDFLRGTPLCRGIQDGALFISPPLAKGGEGGFSDCPQFRGKVSSLFLLLRAQKKKQEKGTPASPGPAGVPYFSPRAGRGKTRASPSDSSRVFSAPVCEARQDKWGNSHWHAAEPRQHRGVPLRDKRHRGPFLWFVSLGKQKNEHTDFTAPFPAIPG